MSTETNSPVTSGKVRLMVGFWLLLVGSDVSAGEPWLTALSRMPLNAKVTELNRTNCIELMLRAFQSNQVVKALIFMPGATDEFYMFRRARATLPNSSPTLADAVVALTNQTLLRVAFQPPFLLLHTDEDPTVPEIIVEDEATAERLRGRFVFHLASNDGDWYAVQPLLKWPLKLDVRPWQHSSDSWHFYRHSFAAWNLTGFELVKATALAGKTRCIVRHNRIIFEPDPRILATPRFDAFPR